MNDVTKTETRGQRGGGEMGFALVIMSLMLLPMMVFAAFGVDLAAWHARANALQTAADSAALAGSVYMPDLVRAQTEATTSLAANGFVSGTDFVTVESKRISTNENALQVTVTDSDVDRYFSQVFSGKQKIVVSSVAEYNLPLPLGSPLNYFGGDATKTVAASVPQPDTISVTFPTTYNTVAPTNRPCNIGTSSSQGLGTWPASGSFNGTGWASGAPQCLFGGGSTVSYPTTYNTVAPTNRPCNIGTSSSQGLGAWPSSGSFNNTGWSGTTQCKWNVQPVGSPTTGTNAGSNSYPPSDYTTRPPLSSPCAVKTDGGNTTQDQWKLTNNVPTYSSSTSGASSTKCSWTKWTTILSSLPPAYATQVPTTTKCRTGYEPNDSDKKGSGETAGSGWWKGNKADDYELLEDGGSSADKAVAGKATDGNRLCNWLVTATIVTTNPAVATIVTTENPDLPGVNPIAAGRSPGYWAMINGPGEVSPNGDAFSTRCYIRHNCSSADNLSYRDTTDPDRGYWYEIKIPTGVSGTVNVSVFDASGNPSGSLSTLAGDSSSSGSNTSFETEYTVYRKDNALDFSVRSLAAGADVAGNTSEGSCHWKLQAESTFRGVWKNLCAITGVSAGQTYLLNVRTNGTSGSGRNGYALQVCGSASCTVGPQPSVAAYADMSLYNNLSAGDSTFYVAEVGPQYNGRILVLNLWDPGDVSGTASLYAMKPSASATKASVNVPASTCTYTATPFPNAAQTNSDGDDTGTQVATAHASDNGTNCMVTTTNKKYNGEWLQIRILIPTNYTCTPGLDPETQVNSCWWGIKYNFAAAATDVTTWTARIEGNPVRLTQ